MIIVLHCQKMYDFQFFPFRILHPARAARVSAALASRAVRAIGPMGPSGPWEATRFVRRARFARYRTHGPFGRCQKRLEIPILSEAKGWSVRASAENLERFFPKKPFSSYPLAPWSRQNHFLGHVDEQNWSESSVFD